MIPVLLWFEFRCGSSLGVNGELPALPRIGDSLAPSIDDMPGDWIVKRVMHNLFGERRVEVDIESPEEDEPLANLTRRDRIRMRKQLEKSGWSLVYESGARVKKAKPKP